MAKKEMGLQKYKMVENKILFNLVNLKTNEQESYVFYNGEVEIEADKSTIWFTFQGKKYETIDHPHVYLEAGFIEEVL